MQEHGYQGMNEAQRQEMARLTSLRQDPYPFRAVRGMR